ncbi:MAG: YdeI/OmpD-associated family protein [Leptospiraceae bacterium]|nr:YdeI/OmpD-associated family protein [Leptospiraceae bacterium]
MKGKTKIERKSVDDYLEIGCGRCKFGGTPDCKVHSWQAQLKSLRKIALESGLQEEIKWGVPCYTLDGQNVFTVAAFKDYCSVSFFKGALLKDPSSLLTKPGEDSQATRQLRVTDLAGIKKIQKQIKGFMKQAIELERSGKKIDFKAKDELVYPEELLAILKKDKELESAFEALTPGRKRSYILHIGGAKQSETRRSRVEKCRAKILAGKGFNEY